jgi:hypothetical protein
MAFESLGQSPMATKQPRLTVPEKLSQSGQMIGWGIYSTLVVIGFGFGIVTGYERPKTVTFSQPKEKESPKAIENPKPESPKAPAKAPSDSNLVAANVPPSSSPASREPAAATPPVVAPAKAEPKPSAPPAVATTTPKVDPKPPTPAATAPAKTDPPKKKDDLKAVSFKTEVLPILRTHCLNCHGLGKAKPKGDVDLTTIAKMQKSPGQVLVAGKPDQSDVYTSITERGMPDGGRPKPSNEELMVLRNWILAGAKERRRIGKRKRGR